jgi:hypothetical protein
VFVVGTWNLGGWDGRDWASLGGLGGRGERGCGLLAHQRNGTVRV